MAKNTKKRKGNNGFGLPRPELKEIEKVSLPFNGRPVTNGGFTFSFACFDRSHALFNLGGAAEDKTVGGSWFIGLMDCLKNIGGLTIQQMKGTTHDLHPVDWSKANARRPGGSDQCEYWQFRLNKSKGRVIGFIIDGVFYIVWIDPHHNLTDSEGYGGIDKYNPGKSEYEVLVDRLYKLENRTKELEDLLEIKTAP